MSEILNEIEKLDLDNLSKDWVEAVYNSEFLEFIDIPIEYEGILENLDIKVVFQDIIKACDSWLNDNLNDEEERSWSFLAHQIKHQSLLSLLAFFIDNGTKNVLTKEHRENAILAARVYYKLLLIPGYKAYHIYHSQLFAQTLVCLSYPKTMCDNEDNHYSTKELSLEVNYLLKKLKKFVDDLKKIIQTLQLTPNDMNFEDIMGNLVDIIGGAPIKKLNIDKLEHANFFGVIYDIIDILICDPSGTPNVLAIQLLYKCFLPKLISASEHNRSASNVVKATYVTYTGYLLKKFGKAALKGYMILLQHLCYTLDGLERSEVRMARVSLVLGLMTLLPFKSYKNIVNWLLTLSTTSKTSHRQVALEILSRVLNNDPEPTPDVNTENVSRADNENLNEQNKECESTPSDLEMATSNVSETVVERSQEQSTTDDNDEVTEEELCNLVLDRTHMINHSKVLRAVYERVYDTSSTIRTRALVILTDALISDHPSIRKSMQELSGDGEVSRLASVGARCVCDERAIVRKAAVGLIHRLIINTHRDAPFTKEYEMLVGLCRDASIVVRSSAIAALGDLVGHSPSEATIDAFLSGPMHQLSDPETKIQEQVVALIQQMLMTPLRVYDTNTTEDALPWVFLAGITRHNLRRHLLKACSLLLKSSNCINSRIVDIVSTHLNVKNDERDLQCLVLLTSVAQHVVCSDISFLLEYYYCLTDKDGYDTRLLMLLLELLTVWSPCLTDPARRALWEHLVARMAAPNDDGCRAACASLAAQLDPDNLQWATDLMQLAESRAFSGTDVREWLLAADVSLVAPAPPSPRLLKLFLTALTDPPPEWDSVQLGLCAAGAGRLCLRSREAASALAPPLASLLRDDKEPAAINALLALTDISTRYSCIVEPLMESVCKCLSSGAAPPLRRAAARSLTKLLLAGYLRLRTPLYYRYCALLADEDHDVREPAEYYVSCCLTVDAIFHHFVDCVVHYNKEDADNISFDARQLIYDVMLQRMSLVQKLNVQCRLAREVLEHAADVCDDWQPGGTEELPTALNAALLDTITLLCGPRMKLPKKPEKAGENDLDDLQERVTTNIVSHILTGSEQKMKRTVAEVLVPAVLRLYSHLRPRGGQLAAYLVRIATDLLNDYRQEIEELIVNDEELVGRVQLFQETIGLEPIGNERNLVTTSAPPDPDTPRAVKRHKQHTSTHRKRALRI